MGKGSFPSFSSSGFSSNRRFVSFLLSHLHSGQIKLLLVNGFSFLVIRLFTGTWQTSVGVGFYILGTYSYLQLFPQVQRSDVRQFLYRFYIFLHLLIFLYFQRHGYVAVLNVENVISPQTLVGLVGFAFYILRSLAVCRVVYHKILPVPPFLSYVLAISFFGVFLAGPIFNEEQLKKFYPLDIRLPSLFRIHRHLHLLIGGLWFKLVFANWLSQWVDVKEIASALGILRSVFCFELQVYFDFAGYSLIALFFCRIFNIPLCFNFQQPFSANDLPEFWRRWHVGLGTWYKETLFLPLKSRFPGGLGNVFALYAVFIISSQWHGATRNFFLWGLFHASAYVLWIGLLVRFASHRGGAIFSKLYLLIVIFFGRLLFMDSDFPRLVEKIRRLAHLGQLGGELSGIIPESITHVKLLWFSCWPNIVVAALILLTIGHEIFSPMYQEKNGEPYHYFRPGLFCLLFFTLMLLLMQPIRPGFVYGR